MDNTLRSRALLLSAVLFAVVIPASAQIVVYDDAFQNGFADNSYNAGEYSLTATAFKHGGTYSISLNGNNYNAIGAIRVPAVTTAAYPVFHFWVNGGGASNQNLYFFVWSSADEAGTRKGAQLDPFIN